MPFLCQQCSGTRKIQQTVDRAWWQKLLMRPASVEAYCPACDGTGSIKGTPEEEAQFERKKQENLAEFNRREKERLSRQPAAVRCSFCRTAQGFVRWLVSSPSEPKAYICDRCCGEGRWTLKTVTGHGHEGAKCSFCRRGISAASKFFTHADDFSPRAYICEKCADIALSIVRESDPKNYFEEPCPEDEGRCSDNGCPCGSSGASIPRGSGYLIVTKEVVQWRADARTRAALRQKMDRMQSQPLQDRMFQSETRFAPRAILCCDQSPLVDIYDRQTAAKDAAYWWKHGLIPLRPTPRASR